MAEVLMFYVIYIYIYIYNLLSCVMVSIVYNLFSDAADNAHS